jgi:hypothetical protein
MVVDPHECTVAACSKEEDVVLGTTVHGKDPIGSKYLQDAIRQAKPRLIGCCLQLSRTRTG